LKFLQEKLDAHYEECHYVPPSTLGGGQ